MVQKQCTGCTRRIRLGLDNAYDSKHFVKASQRLQVTLLVTKRTISTA